METKQVKSVCATCLALLGASALVAKTTTWTGGATGSIADSTWDNGVPTTGDMLCFPDSQVTLTGSFDMGASPSATGLSISNNATVVWSVQLTGAGKLMKTGAGDLQFTFGSGTSDTGTNDGFSGEIDVLDGILTQNSRYEKNAFGTGTIVLVRKSDEMPQLASSQYNPTIGNAVRVEGSIPGKGKSSAIVANQALEMSGDISGTGDVSIYANYRTAAFSGDIQVPDGTLRIFVNQRKDGDSRNCMISLSGDVTGSVERPYLSWGTGLLSLFGTLGRPEDALYLGIGSNTLSAASRWIGKSVTVSANGRETVLSLESSRNLASYAVVSLTNCTVGAFAKLDIAADASVTVGELLIEGERQPAGVYTRANLPGYIVGDGCLVVLDRRFTLNSWTGGSSGAWSAEGNWSLGHAPQAGELAYFPSSATLAAEDVALEGDIGVYNAASVVCHARFTGPGRFAKWGRGVWEVRSVNTYSGGTEVGDGEIHAFGVANLDTDILGSGSVSLVQHGHQSPSLVLGRWGASYTKDIILQGAITNVSRGAIYNSNLSHVSGDISGDDDFSVRSHYGRFNMGGNVILPPGKTVTFYVEADTNPDWQKNANPAVFIDGRVDASLVKTGPGRIHLAGVQTRTTDSLTILAGTNVLESSCVWAGRFVDVRGTNSCLMINGKGNLSEDATLSVADGGKVSVADGIRVKVGKLVVDNVEKHNGVYGSRNLPDVVAGGGRIVVGTQGMTLVVR